MAETARAGTEIESDSPLPGPICYGASVADLNQECVW
jgi:hypothetical protein